MVLVITPNVNSTLSSVLQVSSTRDFPSDPERALEATSSAGFPSTRQPLSADPALSSHIHVPCTSVTLANPGSPNTQTVTVNLESFQALRNRVNPMVLGRASEALYTNDSARTRELHADSGRESEAPNTDALFNTREIPGDPFLLTMRGLTRLQSRLGTLP